jgi:DtxR family transcriptional regulator, Mn-dependent transcriptional regulator
LCFNNGPMTTQAHNAHPKRRTNEGAENYAKAIYELQGRDPSPVGTTAVAERLGVTPASASGMLRRLADEGVVSYEPYHGARLTPEGERIALEVIRHHRLLELFLAEVLDMPWDRVHAEAEVLEHHISEELEELIAAKLGEPALDPHGDPIPDRDLEISADESVPLTELDPGERGVFTRVSDSDASMLRYLAEQAIQPGASLEIRSREPFGGPMVIQVDGRTRSLGPELAERMRVRREPGADG